MQETSLDIVRKQLFDGSAPPGSLIAQIYSELSIAERQQLSQKFVEGVIGLELKKIAMNHQFQAASADINSFINTLAMIEEQQRLGMKQDNLVQQLVVLSQRQRYTMSGVYKTASGTTSIEVKKSCFIATAVYESYDHPNVRIFRQFRDNHLQNNIFGKCICTVYYHLGPILATSFLTRGVSKKVILLILDKVSDRLRRSLKDKA